MPWLYHVRSGPSSVRCSWAAWTARLQQAARHIGRVRQQRRLHVTATSALGTARIGSGTPAGVMQVAMVAVDKGLCAAVV